MKRLILFTLLVLGICISANTQTLIINEVSQGASGNMEYVEFVVVDTTAFYDCGVTSPPCVDIRGWIFDDNSGYHGASGVAAGAIRFSYDPLWSCVELGTIILIHNDADVNPQVPPDDLSMTDGNCLVIAPISNLTLFESCPTTPGAVACAYPTLGWTPGGNWSNTLLANGGDCARLVNLLGCEVFSVCWGSNNLNTLVYFPGGATSPTSASNTVYYFNGIDPTNSANWTVGCADLAACAVEDQTPGAVNNAANAGYIGQFNNNCIPITPIIGLAAGTDDCGCNGSALASGSGSIPGYIFEWNDNLFVPIGQNTAAATNLCSGDYNVIVTSLIGCADTVLITINNVPAPTAGIGSSIGLCSSSAAVNLQDSLTGGPDLTGSWDGPSSLTGASLGTFDPGTAAAGSYDYIVGAATSCPDTSTTIITLITPPTFTTGLDTICSGDSALFYVTNSNTTLWTTTEITDSIYVQTASSFSVDATNLCGTFTFDDSLAILLPPSIVVSQSGLDSICPGDTIQLIANSSISSQTWSTSDITDTLTITTAGTYFATTSNACGSMNSDTLTVTLLALPTISISPFGLMSVCPGDSVQITSTSSTGNQTWSTTETTNPINVLSAGTYFASATNSCGTTLSDSLTVSLTQLPSISLNNFGLDSICPGDTLQLIANSSVGSQLWSTTETSDTIIITAAGIYFATATDVCGSSNSDTLTVTIATCIVPPPPVIEIVIPNVFTPNGDNSNDLFHFVRYTNIVSADGFIVNRWGQVLYNWSGLVDSWNGRNMAGELVPDGTYYYIFEFVDINDETLTRTGPFSLNR
jgi:gliding motility-associated-like protein